MQVGSSARFSRTSTAAANERALARSIDICSCARCLNVTHQTNTRIGNKNNAMMRWHLLERGCDDVHDKRLA